MTKIEILKRLYRTYIKRYLGRIFLALILSIFVSTSTSSIAWLLDPAIEKLFIERNTDLILVIPLAIICAFSTKGLSLYFARVTNIGQDGAINLSLISIDHNERNK